MLKRFWLCLALLTLSLPSWAQNTDLKTLFSGKQYPLTLALKDLNAEEWRRLNISTTGNEQVQMFALFSGGVLANRFYTKGDSIVVHGEIFLIAYRPPIKMPEPGGLFRPGGEKPIPPEPLTPESKVTLSLVSLKNVSALMDIQPLDLKREMDETAGPPKTETSISNLKQIGLATLMYVQDYDEVFPPMKKPETLKELLQPYCKNQDIFLNPETQKPYLANPNLHEKPLAKIESPKDTVLFYEEQAAKDGTRGVCFADGSARRVNAAEWTKIKQQNKLP